MLLRFHAGQIQNRGNLNRSAQRRNIPDAFTLLISIQDIFIGSRLAAVCVITFENMNSIIGGNIYTPAWRQPRRRRMKRRHARSLPLYSKKRTNGSGSDCHMPWGNQEGEHAFKCRWSKETGQWRNTLAKRNCKRLFRTTSIGRDSTLPSWPHYAKNHFVGTLAITPSAKLHRKFLTECMNILQSLMRLPRRSFKSVRSFG